MQKITNYETRQIQNKHLLNMAALAPTAKATTPRKLKAGTDLSNHNALAEQIVNTPRQSPKKKDGS